VTNQVITARYRPQESTERPKVSRTANHELRGRRHLIPAEIEQICQTLRHSSRYPDRDECMVLVAFHHGLRVSELTNLKWQHIDLKTHQMAIKRVKAGIDTQHPISDKREILLLRRLHKAQRQARTAFVFLTERQTPVSVSGLQKLFSAASLRYGLPRL